MKLDQTYSKTHWKKAIHLIINDSAVTGPALVVRKDDLQHGFRIYQHMRAKYKCVYVRMGIVCSMAHLYEEILSQINPESRTSSKGYHEITIQSIISFIKDLKRSILIVIDHCHHLMLDPIFYLLGLILETEGRAQFLFFIVDEQVNLWCQRFSIKDPRGKFFFKIVKRKYELPY